MDEQNKYLMRLCVSEDFFASLKRDRYKCYDQSGWPKRKKKTKPFSEQKWFMIIAGIILLDIMSKYYR